MSAARPDDLADLPLHRDCANWGEHWDALPSGPGSEVFSHRHRALILKRYTVRKVSHWLRPPFARARTGSERLRALGFDAPRCLWAGRVRGGGVGLYERVAGLGLGDALKWVLNDDARWQDYRRQLVQAVGERLGRLHAQQLVHGDMRPGNILVYPPVGAAAPGFCFIDNERTRTPAPWRRRRERRRNLTQINMLHESYFPEALRGAMNRAYQQASGADDRQVQMALQRARQRMQGRDPVGERPPEAAQTWRQALLASLSGGSG